MKTLRELLQAATPGPWDYARGFPRGCHVVSEKFGDIGSTHQEAEAELIVRLNPATMTQVLNKLESASIILRNASTIRQAEPALAIINSALAALNYLP